MVILLAVAPEPAPVPDSRILKGQDWLHASPDSTEVWGVGVTAPVLQSLHILSACATLNAQSKYKHLLVVHFEPVELIDFFNRQEENLKSSTVATQHYYCVATAYRNSQQQLIKLVPALFKSWPCNIIINNTGYQPLLFHYLSNIAGHLIIQ